MFNQKKPLFSRPVLAAIMVCSTLLIWVLNLTAPASPFPTPNVRTWTTTSGIPVIWLNQEQWKNTNKLALRVLFQRTSQDLPLADATFSLLMGDSLPLSTSTINQRLAPLTAQVSSYYDHEIQSIGLTLNSEPAFLAPTLDIIDQWLPNPAFKDNALDRWQRQVNDSLTTQTDLEARLFKDKHAARQPLQAASISINDIRKHYQTLTQHTAAFVIVGDMSKETQASIKTSLNSLSANWKEAKPEPSSLTIATNNAPEKPTKAVNLIETRSMMALHPLSSVQQWLSLQIWGADLVDTMSHQTNIGYVRLNLTLSAQHPWARWRVQHTHDILVDSAKTGTTNMAPTQPFIDVAQLPSVQQKKRFEQLFSNLKNQLKQKAIDPSWWSNMAATTVQPNSQLTLEQFAKSYQNAIDTFNQDAYSAALKQLFIASSYQEIRVHQ